MKRRALIEHLSEHGCILRREGTRHSIYQNPRTGKRTSVPRHTEIDDLTARKICEQLGIPAP
ncbi:MAG: type II toxin-antitoxin system HicA family toxin [Rubrobacteraceae bacterium]|nr:type II toxin-antitoxin system HicA family toxin [Rubrobacteraceae bacterium]MCL6439245.1 type II toxin-antitoxin system HicA family toxin [Rubrobacteraceae bacterium]